MMRKIRLWSLLMVLGSLIAYGADEISVTANLIVDNGNFKLQRLVNAYKVDQDGTAVDYGIQKLTTSATNALNVANVSTPRYCFFRNLSTTNGVKINLTVYLRSNDVAIVALDSTNVTAYAVGGPADIEYWVNEE